jgi:hypothetical protein
MGDDVLPRKKFIQSRAKMAALDIWPFLKRLNNL